MAAKARPLFHEEVKFFTLTPGNPVNERNNCLITGLNIHSYICTRFSQLHVFDLPKQKEEHRNNEDIHKYFKSSKMNELRQKQNVCFSDKWGGEWGKVYFEIIFDDLWCFACTRQESRPYQTPDACAEDMQPG